MSPVLEFKQPGHALLNISARLLKVYPCVQLWCGVCFLTSSNLSQRTRHMVQMFRMPTCDK